MAINYAALEDAIRAWVVAGAGSDVQGTAIYFSDQEVVVPSPPAPLIVMSLGGTLQVGLDSAGHRYESGNPAGEEIVYQVRGMRRLEVTLTCFTPAITGTAATARAILSNVQQALSLPPVRAALNAAGLGVADEGQVVWNPRTRATRWEGQASLVVGFHLPATGEAKTGYIATVQIGGTVDGITLPTVTVPEP